jgi:hypothetical protein
MTPYHCLQTPIQLNAIAREVEAALSVGATHAPQGSRTVMVSGEALVFPYRVYYAPETIASVTINLEGDALMLASCLTSRHYDGRIREAAIRDQSLHETTWSEAFAVQLLGEYVVEIGLAVESRIAKLGMRPYLEFARQNPAFVEITRRRAISYWDCYYRNVYKKLEEFPCYRAIQAIGSAS